MKKFLILFFAFFIMFTENAFATNYIKDIKVDKNNLSTKIDIIATEEITYSVGKLAFNNKIYFDLKDTIIREKKTALVNDGRITTVRAAQNMTKPEYVSRVVLDMLYMDEFSTSLSEDKKTLTILFGAVSAFATQEVNVPKKIIVLDPGHGGKDPGAVISDLIEKTLNLDIAKRVQALLQQDTRFEVYMTRENDTFVELVDRAYFANNKNADLFVSIHNNSMPKNFSGTMLLYNASKKLENKSIAESFQEIVGKASKLPGIGARSREDLVVLKNINMPGVLVEVACMSHIKDRRELRKESFKQNIAEGIYEAIVKATI